MKKKLLLASAVGLLSVAGAEAQTAIEVASGKKMDARLEQIVGQAGKVAAKLPGEAGTEGGISVFVHCTDVQAVADEITAQGYRATVVSPTVLTAVIPASFVETLSGMEDVLRMEKPRQFQMNMTESRACSNVDKIHEGTGLETPFTGKGVVIGVIDQGFEYRHLAFLDANKEPRVRAVWNRKTYPASTSPTTDIPSGGDGFDSDGHATHVTGIAAGSKVDGNDLYGMAPEAELIMIPSTFDGAEVAEDVKYIKDLAEGEGKPWVVNMSFGGLLGPHDGTSSSDRVITTMTGPGGLIAAAMGNDGDTPMHASYTFQEDDETVYLLINSEKCTNDIARFDIWGQAADGNTYLEVKPFDYTRTSGAMDYKDNLFWRNAGSVTGEIDPWNKKEHYEIYVNIGRLSGELGVAVTGKKGQTFHAWCNNGNGQFTTGTRPFNCKFIAGDSEYCVSEGGATIPSAIAVGSYNSANNWFSSVNNQTYYLTMGNLRNLDEISYFSNSGPLVDGGMKPTVCAPGSFVKSAVSKYSPNFDATSAYITSVVTYKFNKYYYAAKQGTSMSTPAVSGILALWLQAYKDLTPAQAVEVIRKTSVHDEYTGSAEWSAQAGYGKIDAYEGLKEVLRLASNTGIDEKLNTGQPVTLKKGLDEWKVLFNNDESYADISLYSAGGQLVQSHRLGGLKRGDESVVSLSGLQPGVYVISINTTASNITRKVVVK